MPAAKRAPKSDIPARIGRRKHPAAPRLPAGRLEIAGGGSKLELTIAGRSVALTNLDKLFWAKDKITKRDLLQYYADISPVLLHRTWWNEPW